MPDIISTPPSDSAGKQDDSNKDEGFLKSAWHKLMNTTKGNESENKPAEQSEEQSKKESNETKKDEAKDEAKNDEQKKSSSGSQ